MAHSHSSNKATHGSSNRTRSPRPVSDPTVTGADAGDNYHNAISDMSNNHNGNVQLPVGRDDLTREIDLMWREGAQLPAQLPRPSQAR